MMMSFNYYILNICFSIAVNVKCSISLDFFPQNKLCFNEPSVYAFNRI